VFVIDATRHCSGCWNGKEPMEGKINWEYLQRKVSFFSDINAVSNPFPWAWFNSVVISSQNHRVSVVWRVGYGPWGCVGFKWITDSFLCNEILSASDTTSAPLIAQIGLTSLNYFSFSLKVTGVDRLNSGLPCWVLVRCQVGPRGVVRGRNGLFELGLTEEIGSQCSNGRQVRLSG
jgi:hypothetical protein